MEVKRKLFCCLICLVLTSCSNTETNIEENENQKDVKITVKCNSNLLFSTYDLRILIDDNEIGTIDHGANDTFSIKLPEGKHRIRIENEEDSSVDGQKNFTVGTNTSFKYVVSCKNDQVVIDNIKRIHPPLSNKDYGEIKADDLKSKFQDVGFTNIETVAEKDLSVDEKGKRNTVKNVTIGKKEKFDQDDRFFEDTKITISYLDLKDIKMPNNEYLYEGKASSEVETSLKDLGFSNFEYEDFETEIESNNDTIKGITIDGRHFEKGDSFSPDSTVKLQREFYDYTREHHSLEDLANNPRTIFENYGQSLYPFGFKCHWFMDLINEEELSDDSTYFKVGVDITNAYGEEYYAIAEGTVTGNTVTGFWINPK